MKKKKSGFTIVEVIVVATIVGILAAVAIPIYINYINSARQESVNNLAETAAAAADIYWRKTGSDPDLAALNLHYDNTKFTVAVVPPDITVTMIGFTYTKSVPYR